MKLTKTILFITAVVAFTACDRNGLSNPIDSKDLKGIWEYRGSKGGMVAYPDPASYAPGNGNLWKFSTGKFQYVFKDSIYRSGIYRISVGTGTDLNESRPIDQFYFNNEAAESMELVNDTLKIYYGMIAADGVVNYYVKISNDTSFVK
ncbi:MAG: hypothetical protein K2P88_00075 [Chitinophagaceae bacterium]|nr:hypothetical protein [Chitinophagaceae bacterium]